MIIPFLKLNPKLLLLLSGFFLAPAFSEAAERVWPILTFTCDPVKNEVKLKNEVKWGESGKNFNFDAQQGTYNPWDLVSLKVNGKKMLASEKSQLKLSCTLGKSEYTFQIKPKFFNTNFYGKCGKRLSVTVSIFKGSEMLLEDKALEAFCHGNSPVLRGIKIKGGKSKVKLYKVLRSQFY